jgi:ubiquinone/menaquinone biosynthesis C-methylase UbiE
VTSRPGGSISFDHVADPYDKTPALTPAAAAEVREILVGELSGAGRALEVGVGTGRIALPISLTGIDLVGVDLARNMLDRLVKNAGGTSPFPLLQADATRLPFADDSFEGAIASWVLHLIAPWRAVAAEMVRVVHPAECS